MRKSVPCILTIIILASFTIALSPAVTVSATKPGSSGTIQFVSRVDVAQLHEDSSSLTAQNSVHPLFHPQGEQAFQQAKANARQAGFVPPGQALKVIRDTSGEPTSSSSSTNVGSTFEGVGGSTPNPCGCTPPDPNLAVGASQIFEMVNTAAIIYAKNGTVIEPTFSLSSFFSLAGSSISDPTVMYDNSSMRWFASIVDISGNSIRIAVSTTSIATGTWNLYSIPDGRDLPDQPFIGTNDNNFVVAANNFDSTGRRFFGVEYWVLNKSQLVNGASSVNDYTNSPDATMYTLRPVRHLSLSTVFYMVTDCTGSCLSDSQSTTNTLTLLILAGTPPSSVSVTEQTVTITTSVQPPNADQPGTSTLLVTNDNRILSASWESNVLWTTWAEACIPVSDTVTRSCVRLVELTTIGTGVPSKLQDFDYATAGNHLFYPALTQSKGEIALIYGESSTTIYPSLFVTGRLANDPINTLQTPAMIVRNGTAYDSSQRYGDYFGAATDPTPGQGYAFWLAGEYRTSTSGTAWSTVIAGIMSLSNTLTVAVNNNASIDQSIIVTNGTLTVFPSSSTFSGRITVRASSSSTGSLLFSKTYNLPTLNLHSATDSSLQSSFILKISVIPYALSSDITLNLKNGTATFEVNVTRNLDIGGNGVSVNLIDLSILLLDYGSVQGDSKYNPVADIDGSGNISILDVGMESFYYNAPVFS